MLQQEYAVMNEGGEGDQQKKIFVPTGGLEPPIFGLGDRRLIH